MTTSEKPPRMDPGSVDESAESEITILPDGRVLRVRDYPVGGGTARLLPTADEPMKRLLHRICGLDAEAHRERRDG